MIFKKFFLFFSKKTWFKSDYSPSYSVKVGSPIEKKSSRIKKFINHLMYILKLWLIGVVSKYEINYKLSRLVSISINVIGTGIIIWYCSTHKNFLSYGLISAMSIYYFKLVVSEIKKPYEEKQE